MEILQSNLHPQPQEQLEQVSQGCGQLGFKCLHGWRLYSSRDKLQDLIKITIKKSFLMFRWNFLYFSLCSPPFVPSLDTADVNLTRLASLTCMCSRGISQALHRKVWEYSSEKAADIF